jgi:hypothetical protein
MSGFHNVPDTSTQDITNEMLYRIISQLDNVQEHCGLPKLQVTLFTNVPIQKLANVFLMLAVQADQCTWLLVHNTGWKNSQKHTLI